MINAYIKNKIEMIEKKERVLILSFVARDVRISQHYTDGYAEFLFMVCKIRKALIYGEVTWVI